MSKLSNGVNIYRSKVSVIIGFRQLSEVFMYPTLSSGVLGRLDLLYLPSGSRADIITIIMSVHGSAW